jgi:type I restriction enzyme S subunit
MLSKRGAILGGINTETISNIVIVLPQRSEQDALMKELNTQVQQLDSGIHESGHVINLLKERRTTLISAAVTGKIDVRGLISKAIPEEAAA